MTALLDLELEEDALVVLIGASGAGKSTLAGTWPTSQALSLDALCGAVSDDFSVKLCVLSGDGASGAAMAVYQELTLSGILVFPSAAAWSTGMLG